jgi:hypothetical protein
MIFENMFSSLQERELVRVESSRKIQLLQHVALITHGAARREMPQNAAARAKQRRSRPLDSRRRGLEKASFPHGAATLDLAVKKDGQMIQKSHAKL